MINNNDIVTHEMHLNPENFDAILIGSKKVEARLYDNKRKKINVGDNIIFYKNTSSEKMSVKVIGLSNYDSLKEMIDSVPIDYWRKKSYTKQELLNAKWPYTNEEIKKYGLLAIRIELI